MSAAVAWRRALIVCAATVALDQLAKALVRGSLAVHESVDLALGFHLVRASNEGVAFGVLGDTGALVYVVTLGALALVVAWFARQPTRRGLWLGTGLLVGGALGNMIDRVRLGAVTDYIDPPAWPAFNVGDVAITLGAVVLVLVSLEANGSET